MAQVRERGLGGGYGAAAKAGHPLRMMFLQVN